jgi:ATP-dependent helicase/nuclease subunit A
VALLEFLVTPAADLKLAQALRSPIFACGDAELMLLAARHEPSWWQRLQALAGASAALARAARLLAQWLLAADRLPAHDLLDRIYDQGEVIARYRLAAPPAAAASVEANLRALLLLALDLDGGRYPSLPRFIDTLRDLREVEGDNAPDEGVIEALSVAAGRVRILTIHGAKGLEAPIVWLLGANAAPRPPDPWDVLVDWPPQAAAPQHFSFYGGKEDHGLAREPLFEIETAAARREELNLLYVAMTRARQVFLASGSESAKERGATPYRLLEAAVRKLGGGNTYGELLPRVAPAPATAGASGAVCPPLPPTGERLRVPDGGERFGILLHALLERRTGGFGAEGWWTRLGFADDEYRRVLPVAERLLAAPALQRFFDAAQHRRAWNEIELPGSDGQLQRIDRMVEFTGADDGLWVLDYKSSRSDTARLAAYQRQLRAYCRAAAAVFPQRAVRGAIIFADATLLEVR